MNGYRDSAYAVALSAIGAPRRLEGSGSFLLLREIEGSDRVDARAPYPLLCCSDWGALAGDLAGLDPEVVSVTAVTDPLGVRERESLRGAFPDRVEEYKWHHLVDLPADDLPHLPDGHRRNVASALARVDVERLDEPWEHLDDWCALYSGLIERLRIGGLQRFSREGFRRQLRLPGLIAYGARRAGEMVAMTLWVTDRDRAYYHLGASSAEGYARKASFALFWTALRELHATSAVVDLGAGAGSRGDDADGLNRFKRGWATRGAPSHLCGRICDPEYYAYLSRGSGPAAAAWFPAYRTADSG